MGAKSAFGKNNFDRLEAAGLVAGEDPTAAQKEKQIQRAKDLRELAAKISKVEAGMVETYVMDKPRQLKRITAILKAVRDLHDTKLPVGAKRHIAVCVNELTSIREGVYASNSVSDKKRLTMIAAKSAREELLSMATAAEARVEKIVADSSSSSDMEQFFKNAGDVIKKHADKADALKAISNKAFVIARMPVVPVGGNLSADRLARLGFRVESLGGYPVMNNQLVLGINPRFVLGDNAGSIKGEKASKAIRDEAEAMRLKLQKSQNTKLQFVSDTAYRHGSGTWFWLMTDIDIDRLAKISPGNHITIQRWGFAFN